MKSHTKTRDRYDILAKSSLAQEKKSVLKSGDIFAIFGHNGDIGAYGLEEFGVYFEGTKFLSKLIFTVEDSHPLLLSSVVKEDNEFLTIDLTNPDLVKSKNKHINKGDLHFLRTIFLRRNVLYETLRITNYGLKKVAFNFGYEFEADFKDIFEVRGMKRKKRGKINRPRLINGRTLQFTYKGLDRIVRKTTIQLSKACRLGLNQAKFRLELKPHQSRTLDLIITCSTPQMTASSLTHGLPQKESILDEECRIETTNYQFNNWINRSRADVSMMLTQTPQGLYPYAGIPWFSTVFGRDGLITALETLWLHPGIARGVLKYLSYYQAKQSDPQKDAEPGKILHEMRMGEMANLKEIPFGLYYGSVDATPLFLILAGHYYDRQADIGFIEKLWPSLIAALGWIDRYGDRDKDGFVEYQCKADGGLSQQGWKDSYDAVFHADGRLATGPIALCEVQAYVYEAKQQMAKLAQVLGHDALSDRLLEQAADLKNNFHKSFWIKELHTYALALDGEKKPCRVLASNAGHALFSGIASAPCARILAQGFSTKDFFSGWGIRTVATSESRYNPMSYHNGSIWPHDNALIAWGLNRYGFKAEVLKLTNGFFEASFFTDVNRLPELFCGFKRRTGEGPTLYPTACSPQTWSSAAAFMFLQACLGLRIDAKNAAIHFDKPVLPAYIEELKIRNLKVGPAKVDIGISNHPEGVGIRVLKREGKVEVLTRK
jgi:glycogen debranching enzyme